MSEQLDRTEISAEKLETLEMELIEAVEHLRNARSEGIPEEHADQMVDDAITEAIGAHGRICMWLEVDNE